MHFHVDTDQGHIICGWLVLDNPADIPEFVLSIPGKRELRLRANVLRTELRDLGMHATGLVGFRFDEDLVPSLSSEPHLSIAEGESGLQIYRRSVNVERIERKFLFLDMGTFPQIKLLRQLSANFRLSYPVVERFSLETVNAIFFNAYADSIFVCGQPNWQRHGSLVRERGFFSAALLREPFESLAERMLFLSYLEGQGTSLTDSPILRKQTALMPFLGKLDLADSKAILAAFRGLPSDERRLLRSPMTSVLGSVPEEELQRRHVSIALDNLAQFNVVEVGENFDDLCKQVNGGLGSDLFQGNRLESLPGTVELAHRLKGIGLIADLLDEDIALYSFVSEAISNVKDRAPESVVSGGGRID